MLTPALFRRHTCVQKAARRLAGERGFTLIEMLVALVAGTIVSGAMAAIVIVSVHFNSNLTDRVDANQQGRVAMEKIVQALNSSCVASDVPPIYASGETTGTSTPSDASHIFFVSSLTDAALINPNLYEIAFTGGSLVMYTFPYSSGTAPSATNTTPWTFSSTASPAGGYTLLQHVAQTGTTPIFQYFGYPSGSTSGSGTISVNENSGNGTLTSGAAVSEVVISFSALPSDNNTANSRATDLSNTVVLRLTPASSSTTAANAPCT
ncbi:MAG TPA: prepilin-type N-terminal cleavage/methylation domain-containing protein [Solirubrobacteraceae bacterium]|nr:prepilin-type N-terminal cleavage/methylation domain-containing protein [Solirubrobacteraceae bacterium]